MKNRNGIIGLFVIAGITLFTVGLFLIGNRHEAFSHHIEYYVDFVDLSGLAKGANVQVAGMNAGQVVEVQIPNSPRGRFRVKVRINDVLHGLVRTDSIATIATEGIVGNTFLLIRPGSPGAPAAPDRALLISREPTELSDLLDQGKQVLGDVDSTVRNANSVLTSVGGNLNATLVETEGTVANVNGAVLDLKHGRGVAGMLLHDETLSAQVRQTMTNVQDTSLHLDRVSDQAETVMADVQSRQIPAKIDTLLGTANGAAQNLQTTSQQIKQTVSDATGPDAQGVTAGANLRETLSNINAATANMADETEALKHNFLLRGFFRHRGYYNLEQISSDKYRSDRLFANQSNARAWLPATELFEPGPAGHDQLSASGKALLNATVAQHGDTFLQIPIVVEGYWDGPDPAEQLARSRNRAVLVRTCLEDDFQIDPSHIGIVALQNRPPPGLDHPTWDGVSIVILNAKR